MEVSSKVSIHGKRNAKSQVPKAFYEVQLLHRYASLINQSTNSSLFVTFVYSHQIPILEVLYSPDCDKTFTIVVQGTPVHQGHDREPLSAIKLC